MRRVGRVPEVQAEGGQAAQLGKPVGQVLDVRVANLVRPELLLASLQLTTEPG